MVPVLALVLIPVTVDSYADSNSSVIVIVMTVIEKITMNILLTLPIMRRSRKRTTTILLIILPTTE